MTKARIRWQFPESQSHEITLTKELTIIGRGRDCDITILDERVSRGHTEIYFDGESYLVSDLGSFNGTYLNGVLLGDTRPLESGDQLKIGSVELCFELATSPAEDLRSTLVVPESTLRAYLQKPGETRFELLNDKTVIGRNQGWDVCLADRAVSRPHAQIERRGDDFMLSDLGSANGTLLNGQLITESKILSDGDVILFGGDPLTFIIENDQA